MEQRDNLNFGQALKFLKDGLKVAREGWNGKGMFIYFVGANSYPASTDVAKAHFGDFVPYGAYLAMKTADNVVVPWNPSQTCLLANDWFVLEE